MTEFCIKKNKTIRGFEKKGVEMPDIRGFEDIGNVKNYPVEM